MGVAEKNSKEKNKREKNTQTKVNSIGGQGIYEQVFIQVGDHRIYWKII